MYIRNNKTQNKNKKPLFIAIVVLLLGLLCFGLYTYFTNKNDSSLPNPNSASSKKEREVSKTITDQKADNKATAAASSTEKSSSQSTGSPTGTNVTPVISYFGYASADKTNVESDAFIPSIFENGTCTFTIYSGSSLITTQQKPAKPVSQYTGCENLIYPATSNSESWSVKVTYASSAHSGTSSLTNFQK